MNEARTIAEIREICQRGNLVAIWHPKMLRRLASLNKPSLAAAKKIIRLRFGSDCSPRSLAAAVREAREEFLRSERARVFDSKTDSNYGLKFSGRKLAFAAALGRLGGLSKVPKGFALMAPEKALEVRAKALAGRRQARLERQAARAAWQPDAAALSQDEGAAALAGSWHLTEEVARRRLERESVVPAMSVQVICPASVPDASKAPAVVIGRQR